MKKLVCAVAIALSATAAFAQVSPRDQVALDAAVVDRVAEMSKRDLPVDLLRRLVAEDIELLRGRRQDGTYEYASFARFEASRKSTAFSVQPRDNRMETLEVNGSFVYRVLLDMPEHRLVFAKNRPVWVERLDVEYMPLGSSKTETTTIDVKAWLQPKEVRPVDLPAVARQATVKVIATADKKSGYGNLAVDLVQAKVVDNADSPYAEAVTTAKQLSHALDENDVSTVRELAARLRQSLLK